MYSRMKFALSVRLCLCTLWSFAASQEMNYTKYDSPRRIEVDLIFPKNQTYKPQFLFPFVFSLNATALWPFDFIFYHRMQLWIPGAPPLWLYNNGGLDQGSYNHSGPSLPGTLEEPLLIINSTMQLNNLTEAQVSLEYSIGFPRACNNSIPITDYNNDGIDFGPQILDTIWFTVSNASDGIIPDLNATVVRNCSQPVGIFSIEGELEVNRPTHKDVGRCPHIRKVEAEGHCGMPVDDTLATLVTNHILNETCGTYNPTVKWQNNPAIQWPNLKAITIKEFCDSGAAKSNSLGLHIVVSMVVVVLMLF